MRKRFTMPPWSNFLAFLPLLPGLLVLWKLTLTAPVSGAPEWVGRLTLLIFAVPWTAAVLSLICPRWITYEHVAVAEADAPLCNPLGAPHPKGWRTFVAQDGKIFSVPSQVFARITGLHGSLTGQRFFLGYLRPDEAGCVHRVVTIEAE
ncbi:MAG TPA: hypothetical protein PLP17_12985 [Oligoflexia bacterium]|nr:hypothetical protein [Oligoflexia bacterium]